jgi:hypothetical protein
MTFSSASLSVCEVDDVAATAAGVTGLRGGGGRAACWRVAGAKAGGTAAAGAGAANAVAPGATFLAAAAGTVLGTTLRAIGRGFGSGTFGVADASIAQADHPTASTRLVAKAVDRNAAARGDRVTTFLRGESFNR